MKSALHTILRPQFEVFLKNVSPVEASVPADGFDCYIGISLNSSAFQGERFAAIIRWINSHAGRCRLLLGDTLHRFNLMIELGIAEDEARERGAKIGDSFINRNNALFSVNDDDRISLWRWGRVLQHPRYRELFQHINRAFVENRSFKDCLSATADDFLSKWSRSSRPIALPASESHRLSCLYLKEEIAGFALMTELGFTADVYPGPELSCLNLFSSRQIAGMPESLQSLINVEIGFRKT